MLLLLIAAGRRFIINDNGREQVVEVLAVSPDRLLFCQSDGLHREATLEEFVAKLAATPLVVPVARA